MPFLTAPLKRRVNVQSGRNSDDQHNTTEQESSSVEEIKLEVELLSNNQKRQALKAPSSSKVENVKKAESEYFQASEADPDSGIFIFLL